MKKILCKLIPLAALTVFVFVMLGGSYLKKPRDPSEDVLGYMTMALEDIKEDRWDDFKEDITKLEVAWNKIIPRIQFSVERDEIYNLSINIARLKGIMIAEDKAGALVELNAALENWKELTR
ncbi:DUF4363 family protein [Clostridium aestuarii]|uniref:DUF4363 family protein n=1 Tax=Clostridium aestuarii TaxID=338193 RepID=A0ABT4CWH7_9CLOT|nr:DUF4363 family protein [Clostridium aestuarii]MCY6483358.1 DUF4363 family protein [Clostridium aestuarii]